MTRHCAIHDPGQLWLPGVFLFLHDFALRLPAVFSAMGVHIQSKLNTQYGDYRQCNHRFCCHILPPAVAVSLQGYLRLVRMALPWRDRMCIKAPSHRYTPGSIQTGDPSQTSFFLLFEQAARNQGFPSLEALVTSSLLNPAALRAATSPCGAEGQVQTTAAKLLLLPHALDAEQILFSYLGPAATRHRVVPSGSRGKPVYPRKRGPAFSPARFAPGLARPCARRGGRGRAKLFGSRRRAYRYCVQPLTFQGSCGQGAESSP